MIGGKKIKKVLGLLVALAAFFLVLWLYLIPQQGGFISSTTLQLSNLTATPHQYLEQVPIQTLGVSSYMRSMFIAIVMDTHVMFANLQLAGSWIIAVTLAVAYKTQLKRYERFAKTLTLLNVVLFTVGATFALTGMLFFMSLFPQFVTYAFHVWWWPLFFEAITFGMEILLLYTLWFSWGRINKIYHQGLAFAYAIDVFIQVWLIDTIAGGMLTPDNSAINFTQQGIFTMPVATLQSFWLNATVWTLTFHRIAGAVSAVGFLLAMMAMFQYHRRKDIGAKRYWDWFASYAMAWGLLGLILQPLLGQLYMNSIMDGNFLGFTYIMHGPRAWAMMLMVGLLSGLFISVIIYFKDRREIMISKVETAIMNRLFLVFLIVAVICGITLVQPSWVGNTPFITNSNAIMLMGGDMDLKYVTIFILALIGALILMMDTIFVSDINESQWGNLPKSARYSAILAGILSTAILPVMGYVREGGRSPWTVYQIIPVPAGKGFLEFQTPIPPYEILAVWIGIIILFLAVVYFVFRITAHHPEKKEEIDEPMEIPETTKFLD